MIAIAVLTFTLAMWLTAPTFGADHTLAADIARVALALLVSAEVARQEMPA